MILLITDGIQPIKLLLFEELLYKILLATLNNLGSTTLCYAVFDSPEQVVGFLLRITNYAERMPNIIYGIYISQIVDYIL